MEKQKTWIDYRFEELEEKSELNFLPKKDMDGSKYIPLDKDWIKVDDMNISTSKKLQSKIGII